MGRKKKYIKELTDEQKSSLEKGYKTGKSHLTRRKCQAILLSHSGKSVDELAIFFGVQAQYSVTKVLNKKIKFVIKK